MIKTIKHIISLFAITSVLALSFMGCKQPTTPEVKDTVAPAEVSDLQVVTTDEKVTLSWKEPVDTDFAKVIITYDGKIVEVGKGTTTKDIIGLENGNAYSFKVQTVDESQNKSSGKTIIYNPYNLTVVPTYVSTQTINEKPYDIVKFGDWPQTKLTDESIITDKENTVKINGWDCYKDNNGAYYIKAKANPYFSKGFANDPEKTDTKYKFNDGTPIDNGVEYYFKLEPIQWHVLTDNYSGKKLLFAEKALTASCFYKTEENRGTEPNIIYPNNYEKSEIRAYLNGLDGTSYSVTNFSGNGFLQKAFTKAAIEKIADTLVDNSADSTADADNHLPEATKYVCANTTDKIFLLSEKEITTADYGFDAWDKNVNNGKGTTTSTRIRKTTDYARATGAASFTYAKHKLENSSAFRLRSPCSFKYNNKDSYARIISGYAAADEVNLVTVSFLSVVPALTITSYEKQ